MTSDVAVRQGGGMPDKLRWAQALAASGLLPAAYRRNPANLLYAVEYGEMLGLPAMAAIQGIHVIDGKPTASAALISSLVRRAGHRLRLTGDDATATCEVVRGDDPDFTFRATWTLERARQAGVTGKDVWKRYPAAMLKARALTECARDACQEALFGLTYTAEELGRDDASDGLPVRGVAVIDRPDQAAVVAAQVVDGGELGDADWAGGRLGDADWAEAITDALDVGDADTLRELWRTARQQRPADLDLHERISAAAAEIAGRAQAGQDDDGGDRVAAEDGDR